MEWIVHIGKRLYDLTLGAAYEEPPKARRCKASPRKATARHC